MSIKNPTNVGSSTDATLKNLQSLPLIDIQGLENSSAAAVFNITENTYKFYATYDTVAGIYTPATVLSKAIKLQEQEANGTDSVTLSAPDSLASSYTFKVPGVNPTSIGSVMVVNSINGSVAESEWKVPSFLSSNATPVPFAFAVFDTNLEVYSLGPLTDNQVFVGKTGNVPDIRTLQNSANITFTNGGGNLSFNTVQNINTGASPTFAGVTLSGVTANAVLTSNGSSSVVGTANLSPALGGLGTNASAFTGVVKSVAGVFSASSLVNADINAAAAIDASKIANGSVSNTEFQFLDGVTSSIQTQLNTTSTGLSDHLADAIDAHDASAISNIPAGNLAATDVQAALNELQTDVDTRALNSTLTSHISNPTGAHAASAISNVAAGNLVATNVQAALDELQTDVDGRQPADSDLTALAALSSTGLVARTGSGTAATRTLTAGSSKVAVTNGDGVAGNPTVDVTEASLSLNNIGGTLAVNKGGTNATATLNNNRVMQSSGGAIVEAAAITANRVLVSDANGIPVAATPTTTEINYVAGVTSPIQTQLSTVINTIGTINSQTKSANGAVISGPSLVMQTADASSPGLVSATGQTFAGIKTFSNGAIFSSNVSFADSTGIESQSAASSLNVGTTNNTTTLNLGTSTSTSVVNIGTGAGTTTINIGGAGDTVNINGTLTYANTTNLQVTDKLITINKGGAAASGTTAGLEVEENATITGFIRTDGTRSQWDFKAPATAGNISLKPAAFDATLQSTGISTARTYTLPDVSGTIITTGDTATVTSTMISSVARNKVAAGTLNHVVINDGSGLLSSEAQLASTRGGTGVSNAGTLTYGANNVTFTTSGVTGVTLPATGTLATLAGSETFTNKTLTNPVVQSLRYVDASPVTLSGNTFTFVTTANIFRITGGSGPLNTLSGAADGQLIVIVNELGVDLVITDNSGANGFYTGSGANITLKQNAALTLVFEAGTSRWNVIGGAGSGGLTSAERNANFTAVSGFHYIVNTSGGAITATLPTGAAGSVIMFSDARETWTTNRLTLTPASGQTIDGQAVNETLVMDQSGAWIQLSWSVADSRWVVVASTPGSANTAALQGGNTLGTALLLGTNDNFGLNFETNGVVGGSLSTGSAWTLGPVSSATQIFHTAYGDSFTLTGNRASPNQALVEAKALTTSVSGQASFSGFNADGTQRGFQLRTVGDVAGARLTVGNSAIVALDVNAAGAATIGPTSAIGNTGFAGASIVGRTNATVWNAVAAGYVGEIVAAGSNTATLASGTGIRGIGTLSIPTAGLWRISAAAYCPFSGAPGACAFVLSTTSASSSAFTQHGQNTGAVSDVNMSQTFVANAGISFMPGFVAAFTGSATIFVNIFTTNSVSASGCQFSIQAIRIA